MHAGTPFIATLGHRPPSRRAAPFVVTGNEVGRWAFDRRSWSVSLRNTRHNLYEPERSLRYRVETETINSRPKMRRYNRGMSIWTDNAAADFERLRRKIDRQDAAIEMMRKCRVNPGRPLHVVAARYAVGGAKLWNIRGDGTMSTPPETPTAP